MSEKKNNLSIWKIDRGLDVFSEHKTPTGIIDRIKEIYDTQDQKNPLISYTQTPIEFNERTLQLFRRVRSSSPWKGLIEKSIGDELFIPNEDQAHFYDCINRDFLLFIYDSNDEKGDIFVLTSGSGFHIIKEYTDDDFPLELGKKIFKGTFQHSKAKPLSGEAASSEVVYRGDYSFLDSKAFGKLWTKLFGQIDPEVVKNNPVLDLILDGKRKVNAEMTSAFTFKKSISLKDAVDIIKVIQNLPPVTAERRKHFKFLETVVEVSKKATREKLEKQFCSDLFAILRRSDRDYSELDGYGFCHPTMEKEFVTGSKFVLTKGTKEILNFRDTAPTPKEVFNALVDAEKINIYEDVVKFKEDLEKISFEFVHEDNTPPTTTALRKYFYGETRLGNSTYFYLQGKWYEAKGDLLKYIKEDLADMFFNKGVLDSDTIPLLDWDKTGSREGEKRDEDWYNKSHRGKKNFYFGDKIFYRTGSSGKIELFDLLYEGDDTLYIIQVKQGFAGSTRDAISQIRTASEIIENVVRTNDRDRFVSYHKEWSSLGGNSLEYGEFWKLLNKTRVYVMACATQKEMTQDALIKNHAPFGSRTAQLETVNFYSDALSRGINFKVHRIKQFNATNSKKKTKVKS